MIIVILFGFLLGFSSLAVLSAKYHRLECRELAKVPVHRQITPPQTPQVARRGSLRLLI